MAMADGRAGELLFLFVLQGKLGIDGREQGDHQLLAGDSCVIPAGGDFSLRADAGLEMLEVCLSSELSFSSSYAPKTDPRP
jgi:hypothetical protein